MGNVAISLLTTANATVTELLFLYTNHPDGKKRYRRTGGDAGNNYSNWSLLADRKFIRWLLTNEAGMLITYTSTTEISLNVETTRAIKPYAYPAIPGTAHPTESTVNIANSISGKVYWKA